MNDLKPCPFCKSGWLYETQKNGYCDETAVMFCNSCKAIVTWEQVEEEGVNEKTRKFVRERWNTRAERVCKMKQIPECRYDDIECDECGVCLWAFSMDKEGEGVMATPNYCPYCGRAVEQ